MNAPCQILDAIAAGPLDGFLDACDALRWYVEEGWISKQVAVDGLQFLAEHAGYEAEFGVDECQRWMSEAFAPLPQLPDDYASRLVRDWELADERDRWRWTGEMPPARPAEVNRQIPYQPSSGTIDAFSFVVGLGAPERLAAWLAGHPDDAPQLLRLYEENHARA
jgi:hypothetical protein